MEDDSYVFKNKIIRTIPKWQLLYLKLFLKFLPTHRLTMDKEYIDYKKFRNTIYVVGIGT